MLTHSNHVLTYLFPHIPSHSFQQFKHTTHGGFGPIHTNPGLILTVPKTEHVGCPWQPTHPPFVPLFETDFHGHIRPPTHQYMIYCLIFNTNSPISLWTVTDSPKSLQNFQQFGPKIWDRSNGPSRPQTNSNITKHLNQE